VRALDGQLTVTTQGEGTRVDLTLPVAGSDLR
jgi:hypothetical protein